VTSTGQSTALSHFRGLMSRFQTKDLSGVTPEAFKAHLESLLGLRDHEMEGYQDPQRQRDLSIRFHWGHDHDFGDFRLAGRMGERHLLMPAMFHDELGALPLDLTGKRVLDIGCWTGGLSLLLCAMGAEVLAIEEVRKYADCVDYLAAAFGVTALAARPMSLYGLDAAEFQDAFDLVSFCGVVYHLTDPVLALRYVFNALRDGGTCLVETQRSDLDGRVVEYWGPTRYGTAGSAEELNRSGWNWFVPTEAALVQMMQDVGFRDVRCCHAPNNRLLAAGKRHEHVDMLRAGLSVPSVR
jgi:2-polyprenyl-3-methyl-5-hydroxy-6-metoxy-1,4-benzoquinol methylase